MKRCTENINVIIQHYLGTEDQSLRHQFWLKINPDNAEHLEPLFESLINVVESSPDQESWRQQFLGYVLESMQFRTGAGRIEELMELLGNRKIKINSDTTGLFPGEVKSPNARLAEVDQNPLTEKQDPQAEEQDLQLLKSLNYDLLAFIEEKKKHDTRSPNPDADQIRDLDVEMQNYQDFFLVYTGLTNNRQDHSFISPLFTGIHHELGHLVNYLKGKGGKFTKKYTKTLMSVFGNEEELYNVALDRFSDHAFSNELELPKRISYSCLYTDAEPTLRITPTAFSKKQNLQKKIHVILAIKSIVDKDWKSKTRSRADKPDGVTKIDNIIDQDFTHPSITLEKIQNSAQRSLTKSNFLRNEKTTNFYRILETINTSSIPKLDKVLTELQEFNSSFN